MILYDVILYKSKLHYIFVLKKFCYTICYYVILYYIFYVKLNSIKSYYILLGHIVFKQYIYILKN